MDTQKKKELDPRLTSFTFVDKRIKDDEPTATPATSGLGSAEPLEPAPKVEVKKVPYFRDIYNNDFEDRHIKAGKVLNDRFVVKPLLPDEVNKFKSLTLDQNDHFNPSHALMFWVLHVSDGARKAGLEEGMLVTLMNATQDMVSAQAKYFYHHPDDIYQTFTKDQQRVFIEFPEDFPTEEKESFSMDDLAVHPFKKD